MCWYDRNRLQVSRTKRSARTDRRSVEDIHCYSKPTPLIPYEFAKMLFTVNSDIFGNRLENAERCLQECIERVEQESEKYRTREMTRFLANFPTITAHWQNLKTISKWADLIYSHPFSESLFTQSKRSMRKFSSIHSLLFPRLPAISNMQAIISFQRRFSLGLFCGILSTLG